MNETIRYFSCFSGIGGFELGIRRAAPNARCVGYSEIDRYANKIYQQHFDHEHYGDITTINAKELPDFDLLVGGFPCQAFSTMGKLQGFSDTRGALFFEIARIAREKQPRLLLLENVKGLLSHDTGKTFYVIIAVLDEMGYDLQWQVLNSKNHGVPQYRERVFIVGNLRGTPRPKVFPFTSQDETVVHRKKRSEQTSKPASTITTKKGSGRERIEQLNQPGHSYEIVNGTCEVSPTTKSGQHPPCVIPVFSPARKTMRMNARRFKNDGEPSFTLTTQARHGVQIANRIRRLTPLECERLQGFPDGWTEGVSDTQRYKTLGNAVTVTVISDIVTRLLAR